MLYCMGDIHWGSNQVDEKKLNRDLNAAQKENSMVILVGDVFDMILPRDKGRFKVSSIHPRFYDRTALKKHGKNIDSILLNQVYDFTDYIAVKGLNIIGVAKGNHEESAHKYYHVDPLESMCDRLNIADKYMGYEGFIVLTFKVSSWKKHFIIYVHHGWGGASRTFGANPQKYGRNVVHYAADLQLYGHVHEDPWVRRVSRVSPILHPSRKYTDFKEEIIMFAHCGTYKRNHTNETSGTWEETKGFAPSVIGCLKIKIKMPTGGEYKKDGLIVEAIT